MAKICISRPSETYTSGYNACGQLGIGTTDNPTTPIQRLGEWECFSDSTYSTFLSVGKKFDGTWWYSGNQICCAYGNPGNNSSPIQIPGNYCFISGTNASSIRKCSDGTFWFQGLAESGNTGITGISNGIISSPIQILSGWDFKKIVGIPQGNAYLGLTSSNQLYGWGSGRCGNLGQGNSLNYSTPTIIPGNWVNVINVWDTILAVNSAGGLFGWGSNCYGTIGNNSGIARCCPIQIYSSGVTCLVGETGSNVVRILRGTEMRAWGHNGWGDVGDGTSAHRSSPILIPGAWCSICPGSADHIFARRTDGCLYFIGANVNRAAGGPSQPQNSIAVYAEGYGCIHVHGAATYFQCVYTPNEYNKNDNAGTWTLNKVYQQKINDTWSDFIPTIDD